MSGEVIQLKNATFKYTIPISKSEADEDGLYIYGEASGPEVDLQDERIDPTAIESFAKQIRERVEAGDPIPYLDEHEKMGGRGVLRHLGDLVDGGVTEKNHLWVKVRLNEDNPAATFLYRSIQSGKKYGMSVSGDVKSYADEISKTLGRKVRTFKAVVLNHIANTTRPVWTPSFGTVLNRAVEKALSEENMSEEIVVESANTPETPAPETPETPAVETTTVVQTTETPAEEPQETPSVMDAVNAKLDGIVNAMQALATVLTPRVPAVETTPVETSKSEAVETPDLEKSLADLKAELDELKNRSATQQPPVLNKSEREQFEDLLSGFSPEERLRIGLAALRGENIE